MPRLLGRLWRSGGRGARVAEGRGSAAEAQAAAASHAGGQPGERKQLDMDRRIEEARRRLRSAIPPPDDVPPDA